MLSLIGISKSFGGTRALSEATLRVAPGRIHALLGENGAGKTTLVRIAGGAEQPDDGDILLDGRPVRFRSPADAIRRGIGMVHQHFTAVPRLTVTENVALGGSGLFEREEVARRVQRIGEELGLTLPPHALAAELPITALARLEIVKALARGARVLLLDEPTALLAPSQASELLAALRRIAQGGTGIVLITHKLREALDAADEITVLRAGRNVLEIAAAEATPAALASAMFGDAPVVAHGADSARAPAQADTAASAAAQVRVVARELSVRDERGSERIRIASFELHGGFLVGVAGVEGSGARELLRAVARRLPASAGHLEGPTDVAFIPEDRESEALLVNRPLVESVALRDASRLRGLIRWRGIAERTRTLIDEYGIRAAGPHVAARELSGGNQQKLVLARELDGDPLVVVADNPTRGLDAQATAAVHARLRDARDRGALVLVHSTDLDEVVALSDRVLVTHAGVVREVPPERAAIAAEMVGAR